MATDSSCRNATMNGVCTFFVASCRSKLRARTNKFWRLYVNEDLRGWTPAQETITELDITIHHPIIASQLKKAGILPTSGSSTAGFSFPFTLATVAAWWTTLLHLLNYFKTVVRNKSKPALLVAMASIQFHILLHKLPESFWALQSLNTHLWQRQKGKSRHHAEFVSIGVDEVRANQKDNDNDDDDDNPMEDSLAGKFFKLSCRVCGSNIVPQTTPSWIPVRRPIRPRFAVWRTPFPRGRQGHSFLANASPGSPPPSMYQSSTCLELLSQPSTSTLCFTIGRRKPAGPRRSARQSYPPCRG
jgi:hypothetical protein